MSSGWRPTQSGWTEAELQSMSALSQSIKGSLRCCGCREDWAKFMPCSIMCANNNNGTMGIWLHGTSGMSCIKDGTAYPIIDAQRVMTPEAEDVINHLLHSPHSYELGDTEEWAEAKRFLLYVKSSCSSSPRPVLSK